ncbi:uncharacterized protein LOC143514586 isoform X2 [Brachyhypopomus gauderio]
MMGRDGIALSLLISTLLHHVIANPTYTPPECLEWELSKTAPQVCSSCLPDVPVNCTRDFTVNVDAGSHTVDMDSVINVTCCHNLPVNVSLNFTWYIYNALRGRDPRVSVEINQTVTVVCNVLSPCGSFNSSQEIQETLKESNMNSSIVLLICGLGAVFIFILLGIAMKIMLRRGEAQNQARKRRRQEEMQSTNSTTTAVANYW